MVHFTYLNELYRDTTEEKALQVGEYVKLVWDNETLLFEHHYLEFELEVTVHHFQPNETFQSVSELYQGQKYGVKLKIEETANFLMEETSFYSETGEHLSKNITVFDQLGRTIYYSFVNTETNLNTRVEKFKFNDDGKEIYTFVYDAEGGLYKIIDSRDAKEESYSPEELIVETDFSWLGNEYYRAAEPAIPEEPIV